MTPTPGASQTEQAETIQPVFATGAGAFLGIDRPTVAMGQAVYPVLTSRPAVGGPTALSTDQPDTTGAFDADLLPPKRISAAFIYRRTDAMQFSGMDSALRMALNSGLQEKLDLDAIAGDDGLLTGTNLSNNNVSAITWCPAFGESVRRRSWPVDWLTMRPISARQSRSERAARVSLRRG